MNQKLGKKFILVFLTGGILFSLLFYIAFGAGYGYTQDLALICLVGGLFFAVAFYIIWIIVGKFHKPISFENPKAQQKLLDYEAIRNTLYECKFSAFMNYGKGLKQAVCETIIYFETDNIHIAFEYYGKIYSFDVPYEIIESAFIANEKILVINSPIIGSLIFSIKDLTVRLRELLIEKGIYDGDISE